MGSELMNYLPVLGLIGLVVMIAKAVWVNKQDAGDANMKELAGYIADGASAFLRAEWKVLGIFAAIAALVWGRGASTSVAVAVFVANLVVYAGLFGVMLVVLAGLVGAAPSGSWRPNQGIRNAARNAGSVAAIVALALALPMLTMTAIVRS